MFRDSIYGTDRVRTDPIRCCRLKTGQMWQVRTGAWRSTRGVSAAKAGLNPILHQLIAIPLQKIPCN